MQPVIEEFRRRIAPDTSLPGPERLRGALHAYAELVSEHSRAYRSLMTGANRFPEVRERLERARWEGVSRIAGQIGLDPNRPDVRIGLRAWMGYLDTAMLAWLDTGGLDQETLVEMIARAMRATIESIPAADGGPG